MSVFIQLTAPEGRRILIAVDRIESVVEGVQQDGYGYYSHAGVWHQPYKATEINMASGDKGKVRESYDVVIAEMQNALRQVEDA